MHDNLYHRRAGVPLAVDRRDREVSQLPGNAAVPPGVGRGNGHSGGETPQSHGPLKESLLLDYIDRSQLFILPNTAGCYTADDAVRTAMLAREVGLSNWVKLEVIGDEKTLFPDNFGLLEATRILVKEGFVVLPYTNDDVVAARKLIERRARGNALAATSSAPDWACRTPSICGFCGADHGSAADCGCRRWNRLGCRGGDGIRAPTAF